MTKDEIESKIMGAAGELLGTDKQPYDSLFPDYGDTKTGKNSKQGGHLQGLIADNFSSDAILGQMGQLWEHLSTDDQQAMLKSILDRASALEQRSWDKSESELAFQRQSAAYQLMQMQAAGIGRDSAISAYNGQQYSSAGGQAAATTQLASVSPSQRANMATQNALSACQYLTSNIGETYDTALAIQGNVLIEPIMQEVFRWKTDHEDDPAYVVPDWGKRSPEAFKNWCLEKDENGNPMHPDAYTLIHSKEWLKMRTSIAGIHAFQTQFAAVMDGKTPRLMEYDGALSRAMAELELRQQECENFVALTEANRAQIDQYIYQAVTGLAGNLDTSLALSGSEDSTFADNAVSYTKGRQLTDTCYETIRKRGLLDRNPTQESVVDPVSVGNVVSGYFQEMGFTTDQAQAMWKEFGSAALFIMGFDAEGKPLFDDFAMSHFLATQVKQAKLDYANTSFQEDNLKRQQKAVITNLNYMIADDLYKTFIANGKRQYLQGQRPSYQSYFMNGASIYENMGVTPFSDWIKDPFTPTQKPLLLPLIDSNDAADNVSSLTGSDNARVPLNTRVGGSSSHY